MACPTPADNVSIAIIGLSCRFPGEGENLQLFWDSLCGGKSAWSEIPDSRWKGDSFWSPGKKQNSAITKGGHFISQDIGKFDAAFFGISSAEAAAMDPQHRLMTEVAYEAVESAGLSLTKLSGSKTGVWMGHFTSDYKELLYRDPDGAPAYSATGLQKTSLANRISWLWDLKGPSFTLDTACSSSLVALHVACQSLRLGESNMAIVGGSNLLLGPDVFMFFGGQGFLSPDGKSKSFDISADGYGRGEGFAAVILKRASDAIRDGDPIRAVIRGTACNQDGHTKGFTLPSSDAQVSLIKEVYDVAGLEFAQTGYVEAHGTGTQAGDTEETLALSQTLSKSHSAADKLYLGSVKANIGHLEAVAGLAAVVKSVLILEHGMIPPNIHLKIPNPKIPFDDWNLKVPTSITPFPSKHGLRRISVNSFGYGGTNAHAVLDDAESYLKSKNVERGLHFTKTTRSSRRLPRVSEPSNEKAVAKPRTPKLIFPVTSQDRDGLKRSKKALASYLETLSFLSGPEEQQAIFLQDLSFTLSEKRSLFQWKTYAVASSSSLADLIRVLRTPNPPVPEVLSSRKPRIGFIFTGQGAQWAGMGIELFDAYPVFRESVEASNAYLQGVLGCKWSVTQELLESDPTKSNVLLSAYSWPLCTVLQVALVDLLKAWNIHPHSVVSHSSGEIAAAYSMGALSRESAWKLAFYAGSLLTSLKELAPNVHGTMGVLGLGTKDATALIAKANMCGKVCVSCINSPSSVTISGDSSAVEKILASADEDGIFARKLPVDTAYHSSHIQIIVQDYMDCIYDIEVEPKISESDIAMHTSVTGSAVVDPLEELGPAHWAKCLISPVLFQQAVQNMVRPLTSGSTKRPRENAVDILVEIGPHNSLQGPSLDSLKAIGVVNLPYFSVLKRDQNAIGTALDLAGSLLSHGSLVSLSVINHDTSSDRSPHLLVNLPPYQWNRTQRYWAESRMTREFRLRDFGARSLLGAPCPTVTSQEYLWRGFLRLKEEPWVGDHVIQGSILYPGAGFLSMAIEGLRQLTYQQHSRGQRSLAAFRLRDVKISAAMLVPSEKGEVEHTLSLRPLTTGGWYRFTVASSVEGQSLVENCTGLILAEVKDGSTNSDEFEDQDIVDSFQEAVSTCENERAPDEFYKTLTSVGYQYGPSFTNITSISSSDNTAVGRIAIPQVGFATDDIGIGPKDLYKMRPHIIHPAFLDAVFHLTFAALMGDGSKMSTAMVPTHIDEVRVRTSLPVVVGKKLEGFARTRKAGLKQVIAELAVMDPVESRPALTIKGFCCSEVANGTPSSTNEFEKSLIKRKYASNVVWRPHLNHLSNDSLGQWIQTQASTVDEVLAEYVKLLHHVKPSISILETSTLGRPKLFAESLAKLDMGTVLNTARYTVSVLNATGVEETRNKLCSCLPPGFVDMIDIEDTSVVTDPLVADLILVPSGICSKGEEQAKSFLQKLSTSLPEEGRIILLEHEADRASEAIKIASQVGLTADFKLEATSGVVLVLQTGAKAQPTNRRPKEKQDVFLIGTSKASDAALKFSSELSAALSLAGYSPSLVHWDNITVSTLASKKVISLLELEIPFWQDLAASSDIAGESHFNIAKDLILSASNILWITGFDDPAAQMVTGIARVARNEVPGLSFRTLQILDCLSPQAAELVHNVFSGEEYSQTDMEYRIDCGVVQVARLVVDDTVNNTMDRLMSSGTTAKERPIERVTLGSPDAALRLKLSIGAAGDLNTLHFVQEEDKMLREDELEVSTKASLLSKLDLATVKGETQLDPSRLGMNAAGVVTHAGSSKFKVGDRVMILTHGAHRNSHRVKADRVGLIPDGMSFEQAASIPSACVSAWYALVHLAGLNRSTGRTILVHNAISAIGRQALNIARHFGHIVLVTVGSAEQADVATNSLQVESSNILTVSASNVFSLARAVKRQTVENRGVDIVLDCSDGLAGDSFEQLLSALDSSGHYIRYSKITNETSTNIHTAGLGLNATISNIDIADLMDNRSDVLANIVQPAFQFLSQVKVHHLEQIPSFSVSRISTAFEQLQNTSFESVLITYSENDVVSARISISPGPLYNPKVSLESEGIYVLSGGLGGLGRSLSTFLIERLGARKLLFLSRSGASTPAARHLLEDLKASPARPRVAAYPCDVSNFSTLENAVAKAEVELGGKVRGVIQCAMVLRDVLWSNMTYSQWKESTLPKVQGTLNLSKLLPDVDFFISLSSFAGIFGNRGQANYAAGNCFLDALARHRRKALGLRAGFTIDVPIMRSIGVLAETGMVDSLKDWEVPYGIGESEFHHVMSIAIRKDMTLDHEKENPQMILGIATGASARAAGIPDPFYLADDARFSVMKQTDMRYLNASAGDQSSTSVGVGGEKQESIEVLLRRAADLDEATEVVTQALVARVAKMQQVGLEEIDSSRFLHSYGVDSLVAIEVVKWALTEVKSKVTVFDIMAAVPITALAEKIASKSGLVEH